LKEKAMNRSGHSHEIEPSSIAVACVADTRCIAGESPVWNAAEQSVYFVDHQSHRIHCYDTQSGEVKTYSLPGIVTSLALRKGGGLIITIDRNFSSFDPDTGKIETLFEMEPELSGNRFNDGKCDRQGRFWAGTMGKTNWDSPIGSLYRLGPGESPKGILGGIRCSNGLAWSPDNKTFYYAESFAYLIHAFDFDANSGELSNKRTFATLDANTGAFPDGLTVDSEGGVWNAQPVFGRIVRYDPTGRIDCIVETPVSWCTSCIFGGRDMQTMYVTSSRETLLPEEIAEEPTCGGLFAFRPGVAGIPETPFEG
jgi:sugar lactone lactonase YvrE